MNLRFEMKFIEKSDNNVYLHTGLPNKNMFEILFNLLTRVPFEKSTIDVINEIENGSQAF